MDRSRPWNAACFGSIEFWVKERLCPRPGSGPLVNRGPGALPNDGDRGEMYAELERACDELDKTLELLKKAGYTLREFSKSLETDPTGILMTHYPEGYMIYPDEVNKTPWDYPSLRPVVDLDYLVELLRRARQLKRAKMDIERRLGKKLVPLS